MKPIIINGIHPRGLTQVFDNFFNSSFSDIVGTNFIVDTPAVNIIEEEGKLLFEVAAPGKEKKDFNVEVKENSLVISSQKEVSQADQKFNRREYSYSSFMRSFYLPDTVDVESIKASYKHGILNISINKKEKSEISKMIEIK